MSKKILLIRISGGNYGASGDTKRKLIDIQSSIMAGVMGRKMLSCDKDILELNIPEEVAPPTPPNDRA